MLATRARMASAGSGGGGTAPTFVDGTTGYSASSTTVVVAKPAGVQEGDLLLAVLGSSAARTFTTLAGWTSLTSDTDGDLLTARAYYKVATGAEPASYTWTQSGASSFRAVCLAYRGVDTADPDDVVGATGNTVSTTIDAPAVTTTGANRRVVAVGIARASDITCTRVGVTEVEGAASGSVSIRAVEFEQAAAGGTGVTTFTVGSSSYLHAITIALNPE